MARLGGGVLPSVAGGVVSGALGFAGGGRFGSLGGALGSVGMVGSVGAGGGGATSAGGVVSTDPALGDMAAALVVVDANDHPIGALNMHDLLRAGVM